MYYYTLLSGISLRLIVNLVFCDSITAASVLRRNPSNLINLRHAEHQPLSPESTGNPFDVIVPKPFHIRDPSASPSPDNNRLVISGHGVVAVPIGPTGERVHVDIEPQRNSESNEESDPDSEYVKLVKVGGTTFQIIGTELTITDDRDGRPSQPDDTVNSGDNSNKEGGLGGEKLSPGQLAAIEFAKTAEEIMGGKAELLGDSSRPGDSASSDVQTELGGQDEGQSQEQPLGIGRRRRRYLRL